MSYEYTEYAAKAMFDTLCSSLDHRGWKYKRNDDDLAVNFAVNGDDLPMEFLMIVDKAQPFIQLFSHLPFKFPEDKRVEGAVAMAIANYGYVNGCFQYDISDGAILYKLSQPFHDSIIGNDCIQYMISIACNMVDKYNDRFMLLSKGIITLADFVAKEKDN